MIETSTRTIQTFNAVCSSCGGHGPDADGKVEAVALAKDEGWQHWTVIKDGERLDIFRCNECTLIVQSVYQRNNEQRPHTHRRNTR